jgi:Flp pilus assembly protein TadD
LSTKPEKVFVCLALIFGTAVVYWPVHRYPFVHYDDMHYMIENAEVRAGLTLDGLKWAFAISLDYWHPITWLSHMMDVQLFGMNAGAHHVVSVVLHIANALLLFLVLERMTRALWPAAVVAGFFAWHPLHVESTVWIAERKDVLSTFFALLSIWAYARYAESNRRRDLFLALLWFAFGLMAKPMLVTLPFVLLLLDYWPLKRIQRMQKETLWTLIREKGLFFLLSAASSVVTYVGARNVGAVTALESIPPKYRLINPLLGYLGYLQKTFVPINLAVIYPISWTFSWWQIAASLTLLTAISIAAVYWAGRRPWLLVGWLWFLGMLVPVSGLVQVGNQAMADRYTYLSLVGIFMMLSWSGAEIAASSRFGLKVVATSSALLLAAGLFLTSLQVRTWSDSKTLSEHALAVTKNNYVAHSILGSVLADSGRLDEAQAHFDEVLRIIPNRADAHFSLGVILARKGRLEEAIAHYKQAIEMNPDAATHYNLGNVLMAVGRSDEAITHFAEALRLDPQMAEAQNNWAYVLTAQGRLPEAAEHYAAALRLKPDLLEARLNVARIREQLAAPASH